MTSRFTTKLSGFVLAAAVASTALVAAGPAAAGGTGSVDDPLVVTSLPLTVTQDFDAVSTVYSDFSFLCYSWTTLFTATIMVTEQTVMYADTGGSDFDTALGVVEAETPSLGACSDDTPLAGGTASQVTITLEPDRMYVIVVGGDSGAYGHMELHLSDRQTITATIDTERTIGAALTGTIRCIPGINLDNGPYSFTALVKKVPTSISMIGAFCSSDGSTRWFTDSTFPLRRTYPVTASFTVENNIFPANRASASVTVSAKVR